MQIPEIEAYFIRHAESDLNANDVMVNGRTNHVPITEKGMGQAEVLGAFLVEEAIKPVIVYTSPAVRAQQTAKIALEAMDLGLEPILDEEVQEIDQGAWEGQKRVEVYTADVLEQIKRLGKDFAAPGGESTTQTGQRMYDRLIDLSTTLANTDHRFTSPIQIAIFSHGYAIRSLAGYLGGWSHQQIREASTPNVSTSLFRGVGSEWELDYLGKTPPRLT